VIVIVIVIVIVMMEEEEYPKTPSRSCLSPFLSESRLETR